MSTTTRLTRATLGLVAALGATGCPQTFPETHQVTVEFSRPLPDEGLFLDFGEIGQVFVEGDEITVIDGYIEEGRVQARSAQSITLVLDANFPHHGKVNFGNLDQIDAEFDGYEMRSASCSREDTYNYRSDDPSTCRLVRLVPAEAEIWAWESNSDTVSSDSSWKLQVSRNEAVDVELLFVTRVGVDDGPGQWALSNGGAWGIRTVRGTPVAFHGYGRYGIWPHVLEAPLQILARPTDPDVTLEDAALKIDLSTHGGTWTLDHRETSGRMLGEGRYWAAFTVSPGAGRPVVENVEVDAPDPNAPHQSAQPRVSAFIPASAAGVYHTGDVLEIHARFDEPVQVEAGAGQPPVLRVRTAARSGEARYHEAVDATTLAFRYEVHAEDHGPLDVLGLYMPGAHILNDAGVPANTLEVPPPADFWLEDDQRPWLLNPQPDVHVESIASEDGALFTLTLSEPVRGSFGDALALVTTGDLGGRLERAHPQGDGPFDARWQVRVVDLTGAGTYRVALRHPPAALWTRDYRTLADGFDQGQSFQHGTLAPAPAVTAITRVDGQQLMATPGTAFDITFSSDVQGLTAEAFELVTTGTVTASLGALSGSDAQYRLAVTDLSGEGTLGLRFVASATAATDVHGQPVAADYAAGETYLVRSDLDAPAVASITRASAEPNAEGAAVFTVVFSEPVTGVDLEDFEVTTSDDLMADVESFTGSGESYQVTTRITSGQGSLGLHVRASDTGIEDAVGNAYLGAAPVGETYVVDAPPRVVSITRLDNDPAQVGDDLRFLITFSEDVIGVSQWAFDVQTDGAYGMPEGLTTGSPEAYGTHFVYLVAYVGGEGTVGLDLVALDGIVDRTGNPLSATFVDGEQYTVQP